MGKLTRKTAKEFSILNWEYKVANDGSGSGVKDAHPELTKFRNLCAYCELYRYTKSKTLKFCAKCPIRPKIKDYDDVFETGCAQRKHPWAIWYNHKNIQNSQAVLDLIKAS